MIYRVTYQSMTAFYGPKFIEAEDEHEAKRKFNARGAFSKGEMSLIRAQPSSIEEAMRSAKDSEL